MKDWKTNKTRERGLIWRERRKRNGDAVGGDDDGPRVLEPGQRTPGHARLAPWPLLPGKYEELL